MNRAVRLDDLLQGGGGLRGGFEINVAGASSADQLAFLGDDRPGNLPGSPGSFARFQVHNVCGNSIQHFEVRLELPLPRLQEHLFLGHYALRSFLLEDVGCLRAISRLWRLLVKDSELSPDRKSTRLNSSHGYISYAVF